VGETVRKSEKDGTGECIYIKGVRTTGEKKKKKKKKTRFFGSTSGRAKFNFYFFNAQEKKKNGTLEMSEYRGRSAHQGTGL
jgi:hypothetical protein